MAGSPGLQQLLGESAEWAAVLQSTWSGQQSLQLVPGQVSGFTEGEGLSPLPRAGSRWLKGKAGGKKRRWAGASWAEELSWGASRGPQGPCKQG